MLKLQKGSFQIPLCHVADSNEKHLHPHKSLIELIANEISNQQEKTAACQ
jgi:hypothetical protein